MSVGEGVLVGVIGDGEWWLIGWDMMEGKEGEERRGCREI